MTETKIILLCQKNGCFYSSKFHLRGFALFLPLTYPPVKGDGGISGSGCIEIYDFADKLIQNFKILEIF